MPYYLAKDSFCAPCPLLNRATQERKKQEEAKQQPKISLFNFFRVTDAAPSQDAKVGTARLGAVENAAATNRALQHERVV